MRLSSRWLAVALVALSLTGCGSSAGWSEPGHPTSSAYAGLDARAVADRIAAGDASPDAAEALRTSGPNGLAAVLAAYDRAVAAHAAPAAIERLARASDVAARQRDAVHSRLYWYTDLDEAKRVATATNRPILSLRMLGRLDQDLSCANSRFFRTTLYPNADVASRMQRDFVLHWSSERPVPVVTIDFGDGRVVRRTITGNSIHYLLDPQGRVVDAIPGLYGPKRFAMSLDRGSSLAMRAAALPAEQRAAVLLEAHRRDVSDARSAWSDLAADARYDAGPPLLEGPRVPIGKPSPVPAMVAIPMAAPKAMAEAPIARAIDPDLPKASELSRIPWAEMGRSWRSEVSLDPHARAVMRSKAPLDWASGNPKPLDDAGFAKLVDAFETHVAEDMVRGELYFRAQILQWLAAEPSLSLASLNERVYSELFLTPANDPWLGLVPPVVYTGIQGDGL